VTVFEKLLRAMGPGGAALRTNEDLVSYLRAYDFAKSAEVLNAFEAVDRARFVPDELREQAYLDAPLPTMRGQTISAPSVVALMTESLAPRAGHNLLEVGTGSGYQSALLAHAVGPKGFVTTVERLAELSEYARSRIRKHYPELAKRMEFAVADGSLGFTRRAPYDGILVTAGAPRVPPSLFAQLREGGRLVIPLGGEYLQDLVLVRKSKGRQESASLFPVMFVPLIGAEGFPEPRPADRRDVG
jgi:protein-L-isoaspartate(D-aspartate) O-methyltransferase